MRENNYSRKYFDDKKINLHKQRNEPNNKIFQVK